MTIVVGIIAAPKGKRKPYFLIGSDTRGKNDDNGTLVIMNNQQKIFPFNSMFLGVAGAVPTDIFTDLPNAIENLEVGFDDACDWLMREVKKYLDRTEKVERYGYWRIRMILGAIEDGVPKMATFEYDTRRPAEVSIVKEVADTNNSHVSFIGDTKKTPQEQCRLRRHLNSQSSLINAQDLMKGFMQRTAEIYPENCNKIFRFESIVVN